MRDSPSSDSSASSPGYTLVEPSYTTPHLLDITTSPSLTILEPPSPSSESVMSQTPAEAPVWHHTFNIRDGHVVFQAENVKFRVHGYFFERESATSRALIASRPLPNKSGDEPIILDDVRAIDLERFLSIIYPVDFESCPLSTKEEWISILYLADKWDFARTRARAVRMLEPLASALDKVVLGNQYAIGDWLPDAYLELCERTEPLTDAEGELLGLHGVLRVARAREKLRQPRLATSQHQRHEIVTSIFAPIFDHFRCGFPPSRHSSPPPSIKEPRFYLSEANQYLQTLLSQSPELPKGEHSSPYCGASYNCAPQPQDNIHSTRPKSSLGQGLYAYLTGNQTTSQHYQERNSSS